MLELDKQSFYSTLKPESLNNTYKSKSQEKEELIEQEEALKKLTKQLTSLLKNGSKLTNDRNRL